MANTLPVSRLINVGVNLSPVAAQGQSLSNLLILGSSTVIDVVTRMRSYSSTSAVATDFGTSAPEYLAALLWFAQAPAPTTLLIGRWAQSASAGQLFGAPLTAAQQLISAWTGIANGGFKLAVDGGAVTNVTGINLTAQTNLNGVATQIQTAIQALGGAFVAVTVVFNATYGYFTITSGTTGATSAISFLIAPTAGTDLSTQLLMRSTSSGAYVANGIALESAVSAVTLFDTNFGQQWYAVTVLGAATADHQAIAPYIESTSTIKHFYGVSTQDANTLLSTDTTSVAYLLSQSKFNKTAVQYSSSSPYSVVSLLGRILTTNYTGNNTVITLMYKQEPTVAAENLTVTQVNNLEAKFCNVFVAYNNNTAIIENGTCTSGQYVDTVIGADALAVTLQTALYNALYLSPTKIPQTDAGTHILVATAEQVLTSFANNGLLGPGSWTVGGFGQLNQGDFLEKGYYIFAPSITSQTAAARGARQSVPLQIAAKLAGAVHTVNCTITVNA